LNSENGSLKLEFNKKKNLPENYKVFACPTFENLNIHLDDPVILNVGLLRINNINQPIVGIWNKVSNSSSDTIMNINRFQTNTMKFKQIKGEEKQLKVKKYAFVRKEKHRLFLYRLILLNKVL